RLWSKIRRVRFGKYSLGRDSCGGRAKLVRLRVGDVAGERHVVATLEGDGQEPGFREAVQDHRPVESLQDPRSLVARCARVDDHRFVELSRQVELGFEQTPLRFVWRVVAIEVEPDLTESDGVVEQPA